MLKNVFRLIDWCLMPNFAVFQPYCGMDVLRTFDDVMFSELLIKQVLCEPYLKKKSHQFRDCDK